MIQLAIFGVLVGAVLGLRFRVLVILPASIVGGILIAAVLLAMGHSALSALSGVVAFALSLQLGYLFGSLSRLTVAAARGARSVSSEVSTKTAQAD